MADAAKRTKAYRGLSYTTLERKKKENLIDIIELLERDLKASEKRAEQLEGYISGGVPILMAIYEIMDPEEFKGYVARSINYAKKRNLENIERAKWNSIDHS